ncbi:hypothetical protein B0H13DRAFT_2686143 [Mycena leptocephala]|nr:hypothetical protein B0H13DRAFT_2686143 [Mycena leptocephala]
MGSAPRTIAGRCNLFLLLSIAQEHHPTISTILYASALESRPCPRTTPIRHRRGSESRLESRSLLACSARGIWVLQHRMEMHVLRIPKQDHVVEHDHLPTSPPPPATRADAADVVALPSSKINAATAGEDPGADAGARVCARVTGTGSRTSAYARRGAARGRGGFLSAGGGGETGSVPTRLFNPVVPLRSAGEGGGELRCGGAGPPRGVVASWCRGVEVGGASVLGTKGKGTSAAPAVRVVPHWGGVTGACKKAAREDYAQVDNIGRCIDLNRYDDMLMGFGLSKAMARCAWGGRATGGNLSCVRWVGTGMERAISPSFSCTCTHGAGPMRKRKPIRARLDTPYDGEGDRMDNASTRSYTRALVHLRVVHRVRFPSIPRVAHAALRDTKEGLAPKCTFSPPSPCKLLPIIGVACSARLEHWPTNGLQKQSAGRFSRYLNTPVHSASSPRQDIVNAECAMPVILARPCAHLLPVIASPSNIPIRRSRAAHHPTLVLAQGRGTSPPTVKRARTSSLILRQEHRET